MLTHFVVALGFSSHLLREATIRRVPGHDVTFIVFPSPEIATQFLQGKRGKLMALKNVSVDFTRKYALTATGRQAQIQRRLQKALAAPTTPTPMQGNEPAPVLPTGVMAPPASAAAHTGPR
jgi:hypothetical protein